MIKFANKKIIECSDWDKLVKKTYDKPYCFQQQQGCQDRGHYNFKVPDNDMNDEMNDSIPEKINGGEMGVKFKSWLSRDPKQKLDNPNDQNSWSIDLWWERNFYPDFQTLANDLHKKGLIEEGEYTINIDW